MGTFLPTARAWQLPWLLLPLLAALLAGWPALSGGFSGDDWTILAIARHGGSPLAYYVADHTLAYSYRPHGMLSWWLATAAFGDQPAGHYLLALALHALNALLLAWLARGCGARPWTAAIAASLFAVHPVALGTWVWLSDRYDLLAVTGALALLLALRAVLDGRRGALAWLLLAAILAAGSKETAFAAVPAGLAWIAAHALRMRHIGQAGREAAPLLAAAVVLVAPFALALLLRLLVFGGSGLGRLGALAGGPLEHAGGALDWLALLPVAAAGGNAGSSWPGLLLLLALGVACGWRRGDSARPAVPGALLAALALALVPALLQAPITRLALAGNEPFASLTNARFYYLALAGLAWLGALLVPVHRGGGRTAAGSVAALAVLGLALLWGARSHGLAQDWRQLTAAPGVQRAVAEAVAAARQAARGAGPCNLVLAGASAASPDLASFADSLVKAQLAPGEPALHCIVWGDAPSWVALTPAPRPAESAPPPRVAADPLFAPRPILQLTAYFPAADTTPVHGLQRFAWDGHRFVPADTAGVAPRTPGR